MMIPCPSVCNLMYVNYIHLGRQHDETFCFVAEGYSCVWVIFCERL